MTDRATLEALLARVLEGEGWDAKLNADIAVALGGWERKWHDSERPHGWYWRRGDYSWTAEGDGYPSNYLGSLDAVVRDLLLNGWDWARTPQGDKVLVAVFIDIPLPDGSWKSEWIGEIHADDKRALTAACLKARMEAQGE